MQRHKNDINNINYILIILSITNLTPILIDLLFVYVSKVKALHKMVVLAQWTGHSQQFVV